MTKKPTDDDSDTDLKKMKQKKTKRLPKARKNLKNQ